MSDSTSTSSRHSVKYLNTVLKKLKAKQTCDSTSANYHSIWRNFNKFFLSLDRYPRDLSWEQKTVLFGTYLVDKGSQSSTIKSYFSAIKHVLKLDGYDWDDKKVMLNTITKSCQLINDEVFVRLPICMKLLDAILFELERFYGKVNPQPFLEKLYKAAFVIAYYGMMRIGELSSGTHPVLAKDVMIGAYHDSIQLVLRSSKTHDKKAPPTENKNKSN